MPDFLSQMASSSALRAAKARQAEPEKDLRDRASDSPPPPRLRLHTSGFDLIAEVKREAPSAGVMADSDGPEINIAFQYEKYA